MKKTTLFLLLCIVPFATGCPKSTPVRPEVITKIANYEVVQLNNNIATYECAVNGSTIIVEDSALGLNAFNRWVKKVKQQFLKPN